VPFLGFDVDAVNGATIEPSDSDYFDVGVCYAGGSPTAAIIVAMKPWNMAGTSAVPSGQDYTVSGTALEALQAGMSYHWQFCGVCEQLQWHCRVP